MRRHVLPVVLLLLFALPAGASDGVLFPFREGDRVSWIGSSSTNIGVWPKTMEFLLRTRHPELNLTFKKYSTGGGTFATGLANLDKWLADGKPTLVFFNYGVNDAAAGEKGLQTFEQNILKCLAKVKAAGARVVMMNGQAADVRKSGAAAASNRELYAATMMKFAKDKSWPPTVDIFQPLAELQKNGQKDDDKYSILKDTIHLTDPAYVGWGYFLYERLSPPTAESSATLTAEGKVVGTRQCQISDVQSEMGKLSFTRADKVLPILPPGALPSRKYVPLEKWSGYGLEISGLPMGTYEIRCEGKRLGTASAEMLAQGVNLNTLLLDAKQIAPWDSLAKRVWDAKDLDQIGKTRWRFDVSKVK